MNGRTGSFFGTVLGRVTMYRLVTLSLGTLAIYAFVLSLFGQVFYKPLELLATLIGRSLAARLLLDVWGNFLSGPAPQDTPQ